MGTPPRHRSSGVAPSRAVSRLAAAVVLALTVSACSGSAEPVDPNASPTVSSSPAPLGSEGEAPTGETLEVSAWFNPSLTEARVRVRIANPIPTRSAFVTFSSRSITSGTERRAWVDGEEVELTGTGSVPFVFGTNAVVEFETTYPVWIDEPFDVAGQLLTDWFPFRTGVPEYGEHVFYDLQVWAPTEARVGGDLRECAGEPLGPTEGLVCAASTDRGAPPWLLIPEAGEASVEGPGGRFRITGAVDDAERLATFGDEAVADLTTLLGEVMPGRVEALIGDVAGSFAGQAIGSILMLDRDYIEGSSFEDVALLLAHELAHTAQDHRTQVSAAEDPGGAAIESMAQYLSYRIAFDEPRAALAQDTNWLLQNAVENFGQLAGQAPLTLLQRVAQTGDANEAYVRREREQNALRYWYLPRAWADQEEAWGTERMDEFLRYLHGEFEGGFVLRRILAAAEERPGGDVLRRTWEGPIPADWNRWS